jgi:hypothetical protein
MDSNTRLYEVCLFRGFDDLWPSQYIVNAYDSIHAEKIIINMLQLAIDDTGKYVLPEGYKINAYDITWQIDTLTGVYEFSHVRKYNKKTSEVK